MTVEQAIKEHEQNLLIFFGREVSYKELKALDEKVHSFYENCCCYEISEVEQEETELYFLEELLNIVGKENNDKVFLNGDPRGYSLKIPYEIRNKFWDTNKINIYGDMGGYGILAPDFNPEYYTA
tara:strand:- start:911 stop:1285 length:375 start_codon:yes stop_codon:yes gene_type:complete